LSFIGWTKNLRRCPEERIERAKVTMQLQRAKIKVSAMPNAEEILPRLQTSYELLAQRMTEYYATKKLLMDVKKASIKRSYEKLELDYKYKELKHSLALQKQKWLELNQLDFQLI
jgi:stearoyl-CoA desaturase (delta-9 desaturase)